VARGPLNLHDRIIKRSFDLAFTVTLALVLLAPLLLVVAILHQARQPRPGLLSSSPGSDGRTSCSS
jgi:lipopolysaccharide/colanic/teichoic acid biosynthesis glycosyltransferase